MNEIVKLQSIVFDENQNHERMQNEPRKHVIVKSKIPAKLDFEILPASDVVYDKIMNLLDKKFDVSRYDLSPGCNALLSLGNHGLAKYVMPATWRALSFVNRACWNYYGSRYLQLAFNPEEDMPRKDGCFFDVYYFTTKSGLIHRLTLTRQHNSNFTTAVVFGCFLDSQLLFSSIRDQGIRLDDQTKCVVYESDKVTNFLLPFKKSNYTKRKCGFEVDGTVVKIHQVESEDDLYSCLVFGKNFPKQFQVFIDDRSTANGEYVQKHISKTSCHDFYSCCMFFVACCFCPLFICIWCAAELYKSGYNQKCVVRKYWLAPGAVKHKKMKDKTIIKNIAIADPSVMV